jgi:acetyltransferase
LNEKTLNALNSVLPPFWSKGNPVDVLGDAQADRYKAALEACLNDEGIDGIVIIFTQQGVVQGADVARGIVEVVKNREFQNKTILTSFMGNGGVREANKIFNANNIPTYTTPEQAIKTYMTMYHYQRNVELIYETPEELPVDAAPPKRPIMTILRNAVQDGREVLTEDEAKRILKYYNFPIVRTAVANNVDEAVAYAQQMGFPVVMKSFHLRLFTRVTPVA